MDSWPDERLPPAIRAGAAGPMTLRRERLPAVSRVQAIAVVAPEPVA